MSDRYARAGVDVDANNQTTRWLQTILNEERAQNVIGGVGGFSGLWALGSYKEPVLAATTDGVGTKLKVASVLRRYGGVGYDIVNHCINDILCSGATPLFFQDYLALHRNEAEVVRAIIGGVAAACQEAGVVLLGGETAEMPDVYAEGDFDLAGTMIGVAERTSIFDRTKVHPGDCLVGLPSSGLHTNGYSLARRIYPETQWTTFAHHLGMTYGDALLIPHRHYVPEVTRLRRRLEVRGLVHITGGGLTDNVPRMLPENTAAVIDASALPMPPIFADLVERGGLTDSESLRTFNLGVGMVLVVPQEQLNTALAIVPESIVLGSVIANEGDPAAVFTGALRK